MIENPKRESLISSESAVSAVVGLVLALGLLILVIGMIRASYVPIWIGDAKYAHMDDAWRDMAELKTNIDLLSAVITVNPTYKLSTDTSIDMGGGAIPIINSRKSSGSLSLNTDTYDMTISAINISVPVTVYDSGTDLSGLGTIRYTSKNNHYLDQTFAYENGVLILVQESRTLLKLSPGFSIAKPTSDTIAILVNAIEVQGASQSIGGSGMENVFISSDTSSSLFSGGGITDLTIVVDSDFPSACVRSLQRVRPSRSTPLQTITFL
ncbi:MAG: hypothetical protein P1P80_08630 [ANME-2 cluster archaeon]|nr:hypothetical protein [ANME-2 cluster archaeon]